MHAHINTHTHTRTHSHTQLWFTPFLSCHVCLSVSLFLFSYIFLPLHHMVSPSVFNVLYLLDSESEEEQKEKKKSVKHRYTSLTYSFNIPVYIVTSTHTHTHTHTHTTALIHSFCIWHVCLCLSVFSSYILKKDSPPQCEPCQCILTVRHILVECNYFVKKKERYIW